MKTIFVVLLALTSARAAQPPNIVFIFADDWGRHASAYAKLDGEGTVNDVIQTPNFDRIAKEGVLFRHAFVSSPSCTPCRSSLFSGKHFWETGKGSILWSEWEQSLPAFPLILKKNGYHIGKTYKGWGPGKPYEAPFGGKENDYHQGGRKWNGFSQFVSGEVSKGVSIPEAKEKLYDEVKNNLKAFIKARASQDVPFFYFFGPTNTHRKWTQGSGKALWNIDPKSLKGKMPSFLPDSYAIREDLADYLGEVMAVDASIGLIYAKLEEVGELENSIIIISGDHGAPGFPNGKCNLYDFGSSVSLTIRIGKDTGINIQTGRVIDRLTSLVDIAPTILEMSGSTIPEEMSGKSLVPVLSGGKPSAAGDEAVFIGRERHVPDARDGNLPYPQRAIRTQKHLFIINFEPDRWPMGDPVNLENDETPAVKSLKNNTRITLADEDAGPTKAALVQNRSLSNWAKFFENAYGKRPKYELYDLEADPDQVKNLAESPEFSELRQVLEKRLMEELVQYEDPRVTGNRLFFERPPMAGPKTEGRR